MIARCDTKMLHRGLTHHNKQPYLHRDCSAHPKSAGNLLGFITSLVMTALLFWGDECAACCFARSLQFELSCICRRAQTREAARAVELRRGARVIEAQLEERAADRARQEELREQASHTSLALTCLCALYVPFKAVQAPVTAWQWRQRDRLLLYRETLKPGSWLLHC